MGCGLLFFMEKNLAAIFILDILTASTFITCKILMEKKKKMSGKNHDDELRQNLHQVENIHATHTAEICSANAFITYFSSYAKTKVSFMKQNT